MSDNIKELLPWITAFGAIVAMYFAVKGGRRTDVQDGASNAKTLTQIETKLDVVQRGVESIQLEFKSQQLQINGVSERVARLEESHKSAWNRIDLLEKKGE